MARGIYTDWVDGIYKSQGLAGVLKMLRAANANGSSEVLKWALNKNNIEVARQAYAKVRGPVKWEMAKDLANRSQYHRAFPMILGSQDPSFNDAMLLWMAAKRNNRETVRFLVRHPKITSQMCASSGKFMANSQAQQLVDEELSLWQNSQITLNIGCGMIENRTARKM
jgi:hypothetical protein